MNLIYIDEAGINYDKSSDSPTFKDGPFIIYAGMFINENQYFNLELAFNSLVLEILGIKDRNNNELHASEMWHKASTDPQFKKKLIRYFEELIQLISKFDINIVVSLQHKNLNIRSSTSKHKEIKLCQEVFLTGLDRKLFKKAQTGIIIADNPDNIEEGLQKLLYSKTKWRKNPGDTKRVKSYKYKFESLVYNVLDQIHYVNSSDSLFTQIIDNLVFIIKRYSIYHYLFLHANQTADKSKLPIDESNFNMLCAQCTGFLYDPSAKDYLIVDLENPLIDFEKLVKSSTTHNKKIK